ANSNSNFVWLYNGSPIPTSDNASSWYGNAAGTYTILATNECGTAMATVPIVLSVDTSILANYTYAPNLIRADEEINFAQNSVGAVTYSWNFGDGNSSYSINPTYQYAQAGTYQVTLTVTSAAGCIDTFQRAITVNSWGEVFIPNLVTPNGDGVLETWETYFADLTNVEVLVFDRWGNAVYHSNDKLEQWTGRNQIGVECQSGVYFYQITANKLTGEKLTYKGNVSIMR
ncbi:MAG: gliding motility-associated C-terminal domain-containing protein, partial [Bacteroidia bacterium]